MIRRIAILGGMLLLGQCGGVPPRSQAASPVRPVAAATSAQARTEPWRDQLPPEGARGNLSYPVPETAELPNGLRLYLVRRPAGVVCLSLVAREGSGLLSQGQSGLAALTTRMLTEGTRHHASRQLAESAEALGTQLDSSTGRDQAGVGVTVLRDDLGPGLGLLAEVVREPAFLASELERVRTEWRDHLAEERQDPSRLASLAGLRLLLGPVLGAPVKGSVRDVERIRVKDLVSFYERTFTPDQMALVVVGDVGLAEAQSQAMRVLGDWRTPTRGRPARPLRPPPFPQRRVVLIDRPGAVQSALFVAQPWPERAAPGYEVREVLATVLGGMFTSRLNRNLREEHAYTYGIGARSLATRLWGSLVISTSVKTEHTAAALEQILLELRAARDPSQGKPLTAEETERAKAALVSSLGESLEAVDRVAGNTEALFSEHLPPDYFAKYAATIGSITRDAVAAEARQRLSEADLLVVVVGARAEIEAPLRKSFAQVELGGPALLE